MLGADAVEDAREEDGVHGGDGAEERGALRAAAAAGAVWAAAITP